MPGPQYVPLEVYRGDSYRWQFVFWLDDARTQPMDLTEITAASAIRHNNGVPLPLVCTVAGSQIDIVLSAAASKSLTSPTTWDLQLTWPSGEVKTVVAGPLTLQADVTP